MPQPSKGPRLGGSPAHERLMLANLATSLFRHGKIRTTEAKARRLRPYAERLVTFAKRGDLASRRRTGAMLHDKEVVHALFETIGPRYENRAGGYTRTVRIGPRKGDNAPMAVIELVEELATPEPQSASRREPRKAAKADAVAALAGDTGDEATPSSGTPENRTDDDAPADSASDTTDQDEGSGSR